MPSFADYMDAIFADLILAADRPELVGKIKTASLPLDREKEQFDKLGRLKVYGDNALQLIGSRFVARYQDGETIYLCIQTEGISESGSQSLEKTLADYGAEPALLDESTYLFASLRFRGYFRLPAEILELRAARDIVDVALEDDYQGHNIDDLVRRFPRLSIFSCNRDSVLANCNQWWLATLIASSDRQFRSELLSDEIADDIALLIRLENLNPENLYYALTSMHWKHCFLELYKCIESLHYLPWMYSLKAAVAINDRGYALSRKIRSSLAWREKEDKSMEALFDMIPDPLVKDARLRTVNAFKDLDLSVATKSAIGRRIYKIRNILVHQEDYEDSAPIVITNLCWPTLIVYMSKVILELYSNFAADAEFNYLLDPASFPASAAEAAA